MAKEREINRKEIRFCEEYIKTLNATQSYLSTYNCTYNTARTQSSRLLSKPYIKKYIEERLNKVEEKKIADANEILEFLTATLRGEVKDQLGFETSVKDRIKAGELLGKRYKLFEDKKEAEQQSKKETTKINLEIIDNSNLEKIMFEEGKNDWYNKIKWQNKRN